MSHELHDFYRTVFGLLLQAAAGLLLLPYYFSFSPLARAAAGIHRAHPNANVKQAVAYCLELIEDLVMRFIALVSGGKDSIYSIMRCMQLGHECCCLANLHPPPSAQGDECDSFTFQTVGCGAVEMVAQSLKLPLVRAALNGGCVLSSCEYEATEGDEVEDLLRLIQQCLHKFPDATALSCGAVLSDYQRLRVENVCRRLKLTSLAPLWRVPQQQLVDGMLADGMDAVLVKVNLSPRRVSPTS